MDVGRKKEKGESRGVLVISITPNKSEMGLLPMILIEISGKSTPFRPPYTNLLHNQLCCPGFLNAINETRCGQGAYR